MVSNWAEFNACINNGFLFDENGMCFVYVASQLKSIYCLFENDIVCMV